VISPQDRFIHLASAARLSDAPQSALFRFSPASRLQPSEREDRGLEKRALLAKQSNRRANP